MSVFGDFQRVWVARFPESALPAAWEEDVRANLAKHRQRVAVLREDLEKEEFYVEYLERLLSDVESRRGAEPSPAPAPVPAPTPETPPPVQGTNRQAPPPPPPTSTSQQEKSVEILDSDKETNVINIDNEEVRLRHKTDNSHTNGSSANQCINEISSNLGEFNSRRCTSELPHKSDEKPDVADVSKGRPASQGVGDFVTVIEVNGLKANENKSKMEETVTSTAPEIVAAKKKVPPRPPPKVFPKRGASLPEPDESPPTSLSHKIQGADSRESLVSHSSSHGTPSITERVKSYESINSLSSERKKGGTRTPSSAAAACDSVEGTEEGDNVKSAPLSLESIPAAITEETKDEPYYDSVPLDANDGEYVYIQAGGTSSSTDDVSSNSSTLPLTNRAPIARSDPPESPGNNSNYVNIDYFIQYGAGTVGSQQSGSADSDGETEGDSGAQMDHDAPLLLRSISTDTEAAHSLAGPHTPVTPRKFQQQDGSGSNVEAERLTMHRCIISSIIESETVYVECLYVMEKYMNAIKATLNSSRPVITEEEFNTIFYKISELHNLHKNFLDGLRNAIQIWEEPLCVGIHFKIMAENINVYGAFLHNYGRATDAVRKCCASSTKFGDITRQIACRGQPMSLEDLLHKPVARVQKNALVLHDLLKYTPLSHPDHAMLTDALNMTRHFLDEFNIIQTKSMFPNADRAQRRLVKNSFIVELSDGHRKLRHLFLFNDVIACAKYKASGREKFTFELKWYIPLSEIVVYEEPAAEPKEASPANIVSLKSQACTVRDQILIEERALDDKKIRLGGNRVADKHRKKLADLEAQLVLASPNLVFRVGSKSTQRAQTFFLSSDFERTQWIESIHSLQASVSPGAPTSTPSMLELQAWVTACRSYLNTDMGSYLMRSGRDESLLLGDLHLNIGEIMRPMDSAADLYVCVEVDSYGHYFRKAKSRLVCHSNQPKWNETFVIELEGSQNVRVLLYEDSGVRPLLRGKCTLKLSRQWLGEQQCHRTLTLGNTSLSIWMRFVPSEVTLRRVPTAKPGALFGAKIQQVCKRQKRDIPFIVSSCVREVERRGMIEVGIYRVSGSASDLSKLKKSFETNSYEAEQLLKEVDIHSVTGILKLYLRELPEALFTDNLYPKFFQAFNNQSQGSDVLLGISNSNRQKELQNCFAQLPDPNKKCIDFLLGHFIRVNQHEQDNKMSLHNLATVFGPTLLRPSVRAEAGKQRDLLAAGTVDVMAQAGILYCLLQHRHAAIKSPSVSKDSS